MEEGRKISMIKRRGVRWDWGGMQRKEEIFECLKEKGKVEGEAEEGRKLCMVKKGKVR